MNAEPFDTDHDAAIRAVLRQTVSESRRAAPRRLVAAIVIALGALIALGGGGYAFAAAHPELFGAEPAAVPSPSVSPTAPSPRAFGSPLVPTETPTAPVVPPATTTSPSPAAPTPAVQVPVIDSPTAGQIIPSGTLTISGTGTPGSHVYLAEYCTAAPPACEIPEELGQPWQAQIIVGADGRWSTTTSIRPPQTTGFRIVASAAFVGTDGDPVGTASDRSPERLFTVTAPTG